jgi:TonB family protein
MNLRELILKENETLVSTQGQTAHNFSAKAQVGQGIEWPKAATVAQPNNVDREEIEMPGEHHNVGHHDEGGHGVSESVVNEDGEGGASAGATASADIATVAYPLLVKGKNNKEKRKNARAAVGQKYVPGPKGVGTGVLESLDEASLATMRDYFAGNDNAKDTTKLAQMRDYFSKNDVPPTPNLQQILNKVKAGQSISTHEYMELKAWSEKGRVKEEGSLEEVDRRGFLKGLGAAAVAGAAGSAMAAPFKHGEYKDQMTGQSQGRYSKVRADNKNATLEISWPNSGQSMTVIDIPGATINFGVYGATGRIKIGDSPVQEFGLSKGDSGNYSWGANLNANIARKILSHSGEVKIEVPIYRTGPEIFKFTIEQDNITKSIPAAKKPNAVIKKDEPTADNIRQSNLDRMSGNSPSASYAGRLIARIKPNITFSGQVEGNPKAEVEVRATTDGTIVGRRITSSSGNRDWDEAVLRAIDKTEVLPRDTDGRVPSTINITFKPKDTNESVQPGVVEGSLDEGKIKNAEDSLKRHAQRKIDHEKRFGDMSAADLFHHEQVRKHLLDKKRKAQSEYRSKMGEAHALDNNSVIYRLDRDRPMSDTEVAVLGGAGRYSLDGLRQKARREAQALAKDLEIEHGGAFRRSAENVKQLTNTLNTIVAAYNELKRIRSRGGRGARGITDEDSNFIRECLTIADKWSTKFNAQGK